MARLDTLNDIQESISPVSGSEFSRLRMQQSAYVLEQARGSSAPNLLTQWHSAEYHSLDRALSGEVRALGRGAVIRTEGVKLAITPDAQSVDDFYSHADDSEKYFSKFTILRQGFVRLEKIEGVTELASPQQRLAALSLHYVLNTPPEALVDTSEGSEYAQLYQATHEQFDMRLRQQRESVIANLRGDSLRKRLAKY